MKILDKHTIRNNGKWKEKDTSVTFNQSWDLYNKRERKKLKSKIKEFSYFVEDKIWWNSLTDNNKENVYSEHNYLLEMAKYMSLKSKEDLNNDWYREWLYGEIPKLKEKYLPQVDVKRNIIIEELFNIDI
jgi:hypothetical protein